MSTPICEKHGCEKVWRKDKRKRAGGLWGCRKCDAERAARWRATNPERSKDNQRASYAKNAEARRAGCKRYRTENPEICRAAHDRWLARQPEGAQAKRTRKWREANPGLSRKASSRWAQANPEKVKAKLQRRRASKLNAVISSQPVTPAMEAERKNLFGGCCYCGSQERLALEHVVPLSKGGLHVEENLLGACSSCNSSKRDRPVEEWYRSQSFFSEQRWQEITCACSLPSSSCAA